MINLSSLNSHKITIPSKPTAVKKSIKKNNIKTLRSLKGKDQASSSEPTILKDPKIEINKNNNKLYHINNNDTKLIARNPISVKKLMHINQNL